MTSTAGKLRRATMAVHCPICDSVKWCGFNARYVVCMNVEAGSIKATKNGGYLHYIGTGARPVTTSYRRPIVSTPEKPSRGDIPDLAKRFQSAVDPDKLNRFAAGLSITVESLIRLGIGYAGSRAQFEAGMRTRGFPVWAFPMRDGTGEIVGLRLRTNGGDKFSLTGGREGLFVPAGIIDASDLFVCEGPTDTAAMIDLGFCAIGRPSCSGGVRQIVDLVKARRPNSIIIVSDADQPGQRGAAALGGVLAAYVRGGVKIITPPDGIKDARAWKQAGATAAAVLAMVAAAESIQIKIGGHNDHI